MSSTVAGDACVLAYGHDTAPVPGQGLHSFHVRSYDATDERSAALSASFRCQAPMSIPLFVQRVSFGRGVDDVGTLFLWRPMSVTLTDDFDGVARKCFEGLAHRPLVTAPNAFDFAANSESAETGETTRDKYYAQVDAFTDAIRAAVKADLAGVTFTGLHEAKGTGGNFLVCNEILTRDPSVPGMYRAVLPSSHDVQVLVRRRPSRDVHLAVSVLPRTFSVTVRPATHQISVSVNYALLI